MSSHLTDHDIAQFKARLESDRKELLRRVSDLRNEVRAPGDDEETYEDGTLLENREEAIGKIEDAEAELRRVEGALARIANGTYGVSEVSGKPIPIERLEALPTATTLVDEPPPSETQSG